MTSNNKRGFSAIEAVVIVAVVALIGALGYVYWQNMNNDDAANSSQEATAEDIKKIENKDDLNKAEQMLDDTSTEDDQSAEAATQAELN